MFPRMQRAAKFTLRMVLPNSAVTFTTKHSEDSATSIWIRTGKPWRRRSRFNLWEKTAQYRGVITHLTPGGVAWRFQKPAMNAMRGNGLYDADMTVNRSSIKKTTPSL